MQPLSTIENNICQLIRHACPLEPGEAAQPVELQHIDWPVLVNSALHHGVGPLAYVATKKLGAAGTIPPAAMDVLRRSYLRAAVGNRLAFTELSQWIDFAGNERIAMTVLKGGAIAHLLYDDIALRPMGDPDLLIRRAALGRFQGELRARGFVAAGEMAPGFAERYAVERSFTRLGSRPAQIDLHWHAFTQPYYFERIPIDWFWERTMEVTVDGRRIRTFSPTAQLLYLAAHYRLHEYRRLIWSYDIALLIKRYAGQIDVEEALEAAAAFRLLSLLKDALVEVRELWSGGLPILEGRVSTAPISSGKRAVECGLPGGLSMRGWRNKLGYCARVLFPSRAYMRSRYGDRGGVAALGYVRRAGKGAIVAARAGVRLGILIAREALRSRPSDRIASR